MSKKRNNNDGWIGYDLDGSLAIYGHFKGHHVIGDIIPESKKRILNWLEQGINVKIMTARADDENATQHIQDWLEANGLPRLEVTNKKDYKMWQLWDDRAVQLILNTGLEVKAYNKISEETEKKAKCYDAGMEWFTKVGVPTHDSNGVRMTITERALSYADTRVEKMLKLIDDDHCAKLESVAQSFRNKYEPINPKDFDGPTFNCNH